jgi:hypothetical protein
MSNAQSQALPTIPAGQTTVLTVDELSRIKTTLLHAEAKTKGSLILSEVRIFFMRFTDWSNHEVFRRRNFENN